MSHIQVLPHLLKELHGIPVGGEFNLVDFREKLIQDYGTDYITDSTISKLFRRLKNPQHVIDYCSAYRVVGKRRVRRPGVFIILKSPEYGEEGPRHNAAIKNVQGGPSTEPTGGAKDSENKTQSGEAAPADRPPESHQPRSDDPAAGSSEGEPSGPLRGSVEDDTSGSYPEHAGSSPAPATNNPNERAAGAGVVPREDPPTMKNLAGVAECKTPIEEGGLADKDAKNGHAARLAGSPTYRVRRDHAGSNPAAGQVEKNEFPQGLLF